MKLITIIALIAIIAIACITGAHAEEQQQQQSASDSVKTSSPVLAVPHLSSHLPAFARALRNRQNNKAKASEANFANLEKHAAFNSKLTQLVDPRPSNIEEINPAAAPAPPTPTVAPTDSAPSTPTLIPRSIHDRLIHIPSHRRSRKSMQPESVVAEVKQIVTVVTDDQVNPSRDEEAAGRHEIRARQKGGKQAFRSNSRLNKPTMEKL